MQSTRADLRCADARNLFPRYICQTLTPRERDQLEEHLQQCNGCCEIVEDDAKIAALEQQLDISHMAPFHSWNDPVELPVTCEKALIHLDAVATRSLGSTELSQSIQKRISDHYSQCTDCGIALAGRLLRTAAGLTPSKPTVSPSARVGH